MTGAPSSVESFVSNSTFQTPVVEPEAESDDVPMTPVAMPLFVAPRSASRNDDAANVSVGSISSTGRTSAFASFISSDVSVGQSSALMTTCVSTDSVTTITHQPLDGHSSKCPKMNEQKKSSSTIAAPPELADFSVYALRSLHPTTDVTEKDVELKTALASVAEPIAASCEDDWLIIFHCFLLFSFIFNYIYVHIFFYSCFRCWIIIYSDDF